MFPPERQGRRRPGASPPNAVSTCSSRGRPDARRAFARSPAATGRLRHGPGDVARQIDLICVPQLMSGEQALAAQIGG
jgi:hypothetical protein